jgi:hypothetical protein
MPHADHFHYRDKRPVVASEQTLITAWFATGPAFWQMPQPMHRSATTVGA